MGGWLDVSDPATFFNFMESEFADVVFPVSYYNGEGYEDENLGNVASSYMLLGAVGMRQVRSKNNTCDLSADDLIFPLVKNCFGEYSSNNEDRQPYGPMVLPGSDRTFKYSTALDLGCKVGCSVAGWLNTYQGGGFFELLPSGRKNTTNADVVAKIHQLKGDRWMDRQTRAIFVDFTVFSLSSKLLAGVQLWYEAKASGKVQTWVQIYPMKLNHLYMSQGSIADMLSEFIMIFLTCVYTTIAARDWFKQGCSEYWSNGWNVFDVINYSAMFAAFTMRFSALLNAADIRFPPADTDFVYLSSAGNSIKSFKYLLGFNSIFTFFKILKYLSHIPMFARLVKVLGACVEDVTAFLINCGIAMIAFAGAFHLTYGNHMFEFASMSESILTLYRYSMGDWDVAQLQSFQPDIGIVYFMGWSLLAICLLLNMFVGIIMESYDKVNEEEEKISLRDFVRSKLAGDQLVDVVVSNHKDEVRLYYSTPSPLLCDEGFVMKGCVYGISSRPCLCNVMPVSIQHPC